jgi:hypothetical protein
MYKDGAYRILGRSWNHDGKEHCRLLARIIIQNGNIQHIEDHVAHMEDTLPEGPMNYRTLETLQRLESSGYYKLVSENDMDEGLHPEMLQPMDFGDIFPEEKYTITGIDFPQGQLVEVWHDAVTLAGKTLSDQELKSIMDKVKDGTYTLTPES